MSVFIIMEVVNISVLILMEVFSVPAIPDLVVKCFVQVKTALHYGIVIKILSALN